MVNLYRKAKVFVRCPLRRHIHQIMNETAEIIQNRNNFHFPRLNLREIQNIINQRQQCLPRRADVHRILLNIRFFCFTQNHFIHTKHRINRRADFVGHMRQKFSLRVVCDKRLLPCYISILFCLHKHDTLLLRSLNPFLRICPILLGNTQNMHYRNRHAKHGHPVHSCHIAVRIQK